MSSLLGCSAVRQHCLQWLSLRTGDVLPAVLVCLNFIWSWRDEITSFCLCLDKEKLLLGCVSCSYGGGEEFAMAGAFGNPLWLVQGELAAGPVGGFFFLRNIM